MSAVGPNTEEYQVAYAEAGALGIQLAEGFFPPLDRLREMIAERTAEIARSEANKLNATDIEDDVSDLNLDGAFDEVMGETRGVLVRVTTWTEWMPTRASEHESRLSVEDGITGFEAGEHEKIVSIEATRTPLLKEVPLDDGESKRFYSLYAFKATMAQNVKTTVLTALIQDQDPGDAGKLVGAMAPSSGLVVTDAMGAPQGNRAQRRSSGKRVK